MIFYIKYMGKLWNVVEGNEVIEKNRVYYTVERMSTSRNDGFKNQQIDRRSPFASLWFSELVWVLDFERYNTRARYSDFEHRIGSYPWVMPQPKKGHAKWRHFHSGFFKPTNWLRLRLT
jgi:hypothetical protein